MPGLLLFDLLFNLRAVLTTNREHNSPRVIRNDGDYEEKFPIERPPPAAPTRVQAPRQRNNLRVQPGNIVVASTSAEHIGLLREADKTLKIYPRLLVEVDEVVSEDVVKGTPLNDAETGRLVLKFFSADSARMLSEILAYKALQPLQGSAVPEFIGVFIIDGISGYALGIRVVEGVTLREFLEAQPPSIELFRSVWSQICAVHERGVAHMDVRDENILINRDGSVFIIDFGLSL